MSFAWEVTVDDVLFGLRRQGIHATWEQAEKIHDMLDLDDIADAALNGDDMDEQTECAHQEFYDQIFSEGKLKPEFAEVLQ